jgi:hypothetical protein
MTWRSMRVKLFAKPSVRLAVKCRQVLPAKPMSYGDFDLPRKRLAVPVFNDAENRALVRIT